MTDRTNRATAQQRAFLVATRQATLATIGPTGRPRLVPVCFAVLGSGGGEDALRLYTPLDDKPKRDADPRRLARVRDVLARPDVSLLVARWDEDWSRLGWIRLDGRASLVDPSADAATRFGEHASAVAALRARYPQYRAHALETRPLIRIEIERLTSWGRLAGPDDRSVDQAGAEGGSR